MSRWLTVWQDNGMSTTQERTTLNECITEMVRIQAARRRLSQTDIARALHVDKAVVTRAFQGRRDWKASEVDQLANLFDINRDVLLMDPDSLFGPDGGPGDNLRTTARYSGVGDELLMEAA